MNSKSMNQVSKIVFAALMLALAYYLPFLTGQIPEFGKALAPMHIAVLIAGLVLGARYGLIVGLIAPISRSLIYGMPPLFPVATIMTFELAAYGFIAGLLYQNRKNNLVWLYISLLIAMIGGRIVWGIASYIVSLFLIKMQFGISAFIAGAFVKAFPGIITHLIVVPIVVIGIEKLVYKQKHSA